MIVCPLCEHPQPQGDTCEVCGRTLESQATPAPALARVPGMETTALEPAGPVPIPEPVPGLVGHRAPDLRSRAEAVGPPEWSASPGGGTAEEPAVPGLERTRLDEEGPRTRATADVACRSCGHRQLEGALCDRCGMRLPRFEWRAETEGPLAEPCPGCGVPGTVHERCRSCGAMIRPAELL